MYIGISEVAKKLKLSLNGVRELVKKGKLTCYKQAVGNRILSKFCPWQVYAVSQLPRERKPRVKSLLPGKKWLDKNTGYVLVYFPGHPNAMCDGTVFEHRLVMEEILGRYLTQGETVHHINRIRNDNSPTNLKLYDSRSEHMHLAHSQELKDKLLAHRVSPTIG